MIIGDYVLAFFQRRCPHPGQMVAVDILEGAVPDCPIGYCRRCGAVRVGSNDIRIPNPFLWRGL